MRLGFSFGDPPIRWIHGRRRPLRGEFLQRDRRLGLELHHLANAEQAGGGVEMTAEAGGLRAQRRAFDDLREHRRGRVLGEAGGDLGAASAGVQ